MTNPQITNGIVKYGRTVKTGDFENKRCDIELSFTMPEDVDAPAGIAIVAQMAASQCMDVLGLKDSAIAGTPSANAAKAPAKGKGAAAKPADTKPEVKPDTKPAADAASMVEEPLPEMLKQKGATPAPAAEVVDDNIDDLLGGGEPPKEITDKELQDAVQKQQAAVKNAPAIRTLVAAMGVKMPPGRIIDIAQAKRQEFLDKLKEVKPLA